MHVLQLYTSTRSFFETQVAALEDRGVECTTLGVPGSYEASSPRSVGDYLRYVPRVLGHSLHRYDVVHANYGLLGPLALAQPRRPVVVSLWGTDLMGERRWLRTASRLSARHADAAVLPSRAAAAELDCGATVIPFAVDTDLFRPIPREAARERVGWDRGERAVLFPYDPARPEKDHDRARRVVEAADVDADLKVLTGAAHEEMPFYLNASDAVLVTSRRESGPMVVKEAAACNVPVVSTDVGFVGDTLDGVQTSHVCGSDAELVAGLEAVLAAPDPRSDARDRVDGLAPALLGERLESLYRRVLADR